MKPRLPFAIAAFALLVACAGKEEKPPATPNVLSGVPVLTGSQLIDTTRTPEAAGAVFFLQMPPDTVAALYRAILMANRWRIVGDLRDQGGTDLYAEREGPPLWIQIRPAQGGATRYTLIGALGQEAAKPDSAAGGVGHPPAPGGAGH